MLVLCKNHGGVYVGQLFLFSFLCPFSGLEAGDQHDIDAVYEAIYDDSTFLFQPQLGYRRNLNLLHDTTLCVWEGSEIKTKQGKKKQCENSGKCGRNKEGSEGQIKLRCAERIGFLLSLAGKRRDV